MGSGAIVLVCSYPSLYDFTLLLFSPSLLVSPCSNLRYRYKVHNSHPILSLLEDIKSSYIALSASHKFVGTLIHVPQLNARSFLIQTPIPILLVGWKDNSNDHLTRTSQEVTHPSTTLSQARLTAEF